MACVMASAVATPAVSRVPKFNRVFTQRSTLTGRGTRTERTRGRQLGTVICRSTKFSEQFGDAGAPKPGTLQSPPLYVKRTLRGGQTVRHPGTVIVLGDVDKLAEVIAGGDVFVWGSLRGDVVAGSKGDIRSKIFSLDFRPNSVVIGGVRRNTPRNETGASGAKSHASGVPQVAEVSEKKETSNNASGGPQNKPVTNAGRHITVTPANAAAAKLAEDALKREKAIAQSVPARKAAFVTGGYIFAIGVCVMLFPQKAFGLLFDVEAITDAWIRVFGVLCVAFGVYYVGSAWGDQRGYGTRGFYLSTIVGRIFIFLAFLGMVGSGYHPEPKLLILGFVNLVGALAMWHALSKGGGGGEGRVETA